MLSVSSLIEFLMNLLRDEEAQAEFERDPHGMLARHGLDGLCGQDVRDVAPLVADHENVHVKSGGQVHSGGDDAVSEINYIKQNYEVNATVNDNDVYNFSYVDDRDTVVNIDDRDTTVINAEGDVTIEDSFNSETDVEVNQVHDSFNEDNDGVDNKGGSIDDSGVAGNDLDASDDDTAIDASDDDTTTTTVEESFNPDNEGADIGAEGDTVDVAVEEEPEELETVA